MALSKSSSRIKEYFPPMQLGVGIPNGAEAIIHSMAFAIENLKPDESALQVDFSNAFNLIDRSAFLSIVKEAFPDLFNLVGYLYSAQGRLLAGDSCIYSCQGVQQGDPLGPFLFSLVLQELLFKIRNNFPNLILNLWYLDDGSLVGSNDDLLQILKLIDSEGAALGLQLNLKKCVVIGSDLDKFPSDIVRATDGLLVLGAPVGNRSYVSNAVREIVTKAAALMSKVKKLDNPQEELLLLRSCTGAPKLIYWLRTVCPLWIFEECILFDQITNDALAHIFGSPLSTTERFLAHLWVVWGSQLLIIWHLTVSFLRLVLPGLSNHRLFLVSVFPTVSPF
jgi:hypothetical protein